MSKIIGIDLGTTCLLYTSPRRGHLGAQAGKLNARTDEKEEPRRPSFFVSPSTARAARAQQFVR